MPAGTSLALGDLFRIVGLLEDRLIFGEERHDDSCAPVGREKQRRRAVLHAWRVVLSDDGQEQIAFFIPASRSETHRTLERRWDLLSHENFLWTDGCFLR